MKEAIIIICVLVIVFVPNILFKNYLKDSGKELIKILEDLENDVKNGNTENAENAKKLKDKFLEKEKKWILIVDHDILDEIEDGIAECIAYYNDEEKTEFISAYNKLKEHIKDLKKREEISLANIM